jgi:hypothetical protein
MIPERGKAPASVSAQAPDRFAIRFEDRLPPGWSAALSLALSEAKVDIERLSAVKATGNRWIVELLVKTSPGSSDVKRLDLVALAWSSTRGVPPGRVVLEDYHIDERENDGALLLDVRAADRTGFLATLLACLAGLSLFPEQLEVETVDGEVRDSFVLKGIGGSYPSESIRQALETTLQDLLSLPAQRARHER